MKAIDFLNVAIRARTMQMYYHFCHNLVSGETFFQDHEAFGEFYPALEGDYDRLVEYMIATLGPKALDVKLVNESLFDELNKLKVDKLCCCEMFEKGLELEQEYVKALTKLDKMAPIGLRNLVGDLAEKSDVRTYKIKQRIKKEK